MTYLRLQRARELVVPTREATLRRDASVARFWSDNTPLLIEAWKEWEASERDRLPRLDDSLVDERLRVAVDRAWDDPGTESSVQELWQSVSPGVLQTPFFDPERLADLRAYLEAAEGAQIPVRPPYGIVLNRGGAMLDRRSDGFLGGPAFQSFYQRMLDHYMRPIARLLFREVAGYDTQSFGFSIRYRPGGDTSIRPHTDASAVTLNINLNLPTEGFSGSVVDFLDPRTGASNEVVFQPGMAVIHRGSVAHAARPITSGERSNFVFWLYGERGAMPQRVGPNGSDDARQRWTVPTVPNDDFAPF